MKQVPDVIFPTATNELGRIRLGYAHIFTFPGNFPIIRLGSHSVGNV